MIVSCSWLRDYIDTDLSPQEIAAVITSTGLEVESIEKFESVKGGLEGLVVGEVTEKWKHPDADRLSVTQVKINAAGEIHQVVCGAANVAAGQKVILALPGATLYPASGESFTIKKSKIRGVESEGMICAEDEIGLGQSHDGIMVLDPDTPVGMQAAVYFNVATDTVLHIGLTPNRIDGASHIGVARDLAAAISVRNKKDITVRIPEIKNITATGNCPVSIQIEEKELCKRYCGLVIENVQISESPQWLKNRLLAAGLRPLNNIIDITNYVMMECGQPLHAFDANELAGNKIVVRTSTPGQKFTTLDEVERKLSGTELMICDAEKPLCIAGVFGGLHSGIKNTTQRVFLESAWFDGVSVRKTAKLHGLHTDASFRFERGADIQMAPWALARAATLIMEICGGQLQGDISDVCAEKTILHTVDFSPARFEAFAGISIPATDLRELLRRLDIQITGESAGQWKLTIPSYRVDVLREADVHEEILRIVGYDYVPFADKLTTSLSYRNHPDKEKYMQAVSDFLSARGLHEILSNSLTGKQWSALMGQPEKENVTLLNPLSQELDTLRASMAGGGLEAIAWNINRQQNDLQFYEWGNTYHLQHEKYVEKEWLAVWITGNKFSVDWKKGAQDAGLFYLFSVVESLLERFVGGHKYDRKIAENSLLIHEVRYDASGKTMVRCGELHDAVLDAAGIDQPVFYAEFDWAAMLEVMGSQKTKFRELSRFPAVRRDLSLLLDEKVTFDDIIRQVKKVDPKLIREVFIFDEYRGANLGDAKKSYAIGLQIQHDEKTLTDDEVEKLMEKVVTRLQEKTGATLRA